MSIRAVYGDQTEKEKKYKSTLESIVSAAKDEKYFFQEHMILIPQTISFTKYFIGFYDLVDFILILEIPPKLQSK